MENYDFSFLDETIEKEYHYCGYSIKIASVPTIKGTKYYGTTRTGQASLHPPYFHDQIFGAENEIQEYIDQLINKIF